MMEKRQWLLILYNKNLQDKLNKRLINYKILIRKNGYGKVYKYEKVIYDRVFSDGKRNGKGKEFNVDGDILFEGENLNGKKWKGKGKEYHNENNLIFEGEYSNGEIRVKIKDYYRSGLIRF